MSGFCKERQGKPRVERIEHREGSCHVQSSGVHGRQAALYARSGRSEDALRILNELKDLSGSVYVATPVFTAIYSPLGDLASWREKMREALEQRTSELVFLKVYPWLDNLRSDPVYLVIVAKIGLP